MIDFLMLIVIAVLAPVIMILVCLVKGFRVPVLHKDSSNQDTLYFAKPDLTVLNCRVQPAKQKAADCFVDVLKVELCGSIGTAADTNHTILQIFITDITDGIQKSKPVHSNIEQWQMQDSPTFCYNADLGKLPDQHTVLSDWTAAAQLRLDWLMFPRKGKRTLQFSTSVLSHRSGDELACAACVFTYDNDAPGYIDLQENIQQAKTMAVSLAFVVSAADNNMPDCEIELIKSWTKNNIDMPCKDRCKLEKALDKAIAFYHRNYNQIDTRKICREIVEITQLSERYDILELCMQVARADGRAAAAELALLKQFAVWLEVDHHRFRDMMAKILPADMHEIQDEEIILGITSDMSKDKARQLLNQEYRKWNARVTNYDPEIQNQADHMLRFIAEARSGYIG